MATDAGDISRALAHRIIALVQELLPLGKREGHEWKAGSTDPRDQGRSLSVCLAGARAGVWADFSSNESGDALDLVAAVRYLGNKADALAWSRQWLGFGSDAPAAAHRPERAPHSDTDGQQEEADRIRIAQKIWLAGQPTLKGTPAADYLAGRGIDLERLGRQPRALRFHRSLFNRESGDSWPALVAALSNDQGQHVATHRTWLARRDGVWGKAPLRDARKAIGVVRGASIRLWRGASGRALAVAPDGDSVAIAEGIETSFSVAIACPELRVLCAVSLSNMANITLPPAIARVILCADNDPGNEKAADALRRAVQRYQGEGRDVHVAMPETPGFDWNDQLQAKATI